MAVYLCIYVRCYLLILLQSFQCRGGIISDLCRSQSLGTSHSNRVSCTILSVEMFPREYLLTQGRDDSSTAGVFQYTVPYHTILFIVILHEEKNRIEISNIIQLTTFPYSTIPYNTGHYNTI